MLWGRTYGPVRQSAGVSDAWPGVGSSHAILFFAVRDDARSAPSTLNTDPLKDGVIQNQPYQQLAPIQRTPGIYQGWIYLLAEQPSAASTTAAWVERFYFLQRRSMRRHDATEGAPSAESTWWSSSANANTAWFTPMGSEWPATGQRSSADSPSASA